MKHKILISHLLRRTNITFTILLLIFNIFTFIVSSSNKNVFITLSIFFACLTFFLYRLNIIKMISRNWLELKKEILYINYPYTVAAFFALIILIFIGDIYNLSNLNKEALNTTFIFTYFMSTISMLLPSILMLSYMYLICPAFVIPSYEGQKKKRKRKIDMLVITLFILFILYSGTAIIQATVNSLTFSTREKFKAVKLPIEYSKEYLKYTDLSETTKNKLQRQKTEVPFLYTSEGFRFKTYEEAENFCHSLNAKVANPVEIYNIIFHRFDTYGERYYWTNEKAGRTRLVLHFKNMSYEIMKVPENVRPLTYCTSKANKNYNMFDEKYFFRIKPVEIETDKAKIDKKDYTYPPQKIEKTSVDIKKELIDDTIKHVNFNVKEVSRSYFNELINEGYDYNPEVKVNEYYASDERTLQSSINRDSDMRNIRLCYYPFLNYENMDMRNEAQIWKQSFCSPSFKLVNTQPILKSKYEKDAYCYANGGRVPNIPELMGIIKTFNLSSNEALYWTNNKITDSKTGNSIPVAIGVENGAFAYAQTPTTQKAYTFCITRPEIRSRILANNKSRYKGLTGKYYANKICPTCKYYEVPDTVLSKSSF